MIGLFAFLAAVLSNGPGRADVHAGVEAYKQGDYATALREFVDLAESGDPRAQYNLAVMYLKGRGVEKDLARAFELQHSAAKSGLAAAQHGLAIMYYRGDGATQDHAEAAKWFRRAADRGFPMSQLNLGVLYFSGQGVERNDAEVVKWITLAAAKGLPEALFRLGKMYEQGAIFAKSLQDAIYWYGKSGERGHADGDGEVKRLKALLAVKEASGQKPEEGAPAAPAAPSAKVEITPPDPTPEPKFAEPASEQPPEPEPEPERQPKPEIRAWSAQLASFRTLREAKKAWTELKQTLGDALDGLQPDIVRVDLGPERGVYHRLRATPLNSRDAAFAFCNRLKMKSAGQGCIPRSPSR